MNIELSGSAGDGKIILDNFNRFSYQFIETSSSEVHKVFEVTFFHNKGTLNFFIDDKNNVKDTTLMFEKFPKPLGAHNDPTLNKLGEKIRDNF